MSNYYVKCSRCGINNPLYESVCKNCGSIIRDRITSLDFWNIIGQLIERPKEAIIHIIQAEQKNFATFVLLAGLFKIFLLSSIISGVLSNGNFSILNFLFFSLVCTALIILTAFFLKKMVAGKEAKFRIKDFYAGMAYSFMPQLIGLFILFVMEFIVFGEQLFTFNPSPFLVKENFAYLFSALEIGIVIWNVSLLSKLFSIYFSKKFLSFLTSFLLIGLIYLSTNIFL